MKVAIIGAGGFVGRRIVDRLSDDPDVDALSLVDRAPMPRPARPASTLHTGDFSDPGLRADALDGADAVILLASVLGGAAEADYALARAVNVDATLDLFEYLRDTAPRTRLVFASTVAVYGGSLPDPVTDATPFAPRMVYGAQKLMMEVALSNFAEKGWLDGMSLRPAGVVARDGVDAALKSAFFSRLFWSVKRGEDITLPVARHSRTWLSSVDAVAANFIHAAKLRDPAHRALTLPALSLTFGDLVDALLARFPDSPAGVRFDPDPDTDALFGRFPGLETENADRLGFVRDPDAAALVDSAYL
jgi:nucleoside-diphosphate-sugar epimerase